MQISIIIQTKDIDAIEIVGEIKKFAEEKFKSNIVGQIEFHIKNIKNLKQIEKG